MTDNRKIEYAEIGIPSTTVRQIELDSSKLDDQELPQFSKEVPFSSKKWERGDSVVVEHKWKSSLCSNMRTSEITFRKGEQLEAIHMLSARDGVDTASHLQGNWVYIFRKTTGEIAKSLYSACSRLQAGLENVVGWLKTVLGNFYVISKVERVVWTFDKRLAKHDSMNYVETENLVEVQKKKLCEMVVKTISSLHSKSMVLGRFTLNSLILTNDGMQLTDLRGLRAARKRAFCVDEFKAVMQYLFALGMMKQEDAYYSIALYHAENEQGCSEWYKERIGKTGDALKVTNRMQAEIF
jgi:tRNA A-37 threonylcarbamoyl transferase component Bud32